MSPGEGFRLVGTRTLLRSGFLTFERLHMSGPRGEPMERIAVRHPGAVAVIPINGSDVVLIEQYRSPLGTALIEIPAGKLDVDGEPPEAAAHRELIEEVGVAAGAMTELTTIATAPGFCDERIILYLATNLTPVDSAPTGVEESAARVLEIPMATALAMIDRGEIVDAKTIAGLHLAARRL